MRNNLLFETCKEVERYWRLKDRIDRETVNGLVTTKIYTNKENEIAVLSLKNGEYISLTIM